MAKGVRMDNQRVKETRSVELLSPHGSEIVVTPTRAKQLLERPPLAFADGVSRKYVKAGESNVVSTRAETTTAAQAPRKGSGANSGGE